MEEPARKFVHIATAEDASSRTCNWERIDSSNQKPHVHTDKVKDTNSNILVKLVEEKVSKK